MTPSDWGNFSHSLFCSSRPRPLNIQPEDHSQGSQIVEGNHQHSRLSGPWLHKSPTLPRTSPALCAAPRTSSGPSTLPRIFPRRAHRPASPRHCARRRGRPLRRPRRRACPLGVDFAARALQVVYAPVHVLRVPHIAAHLLHNVYGAAHIGHAAAHLYLLNVYGAAHRGHSAGHVLGAAHVAVYAPLRCARPPHCVWRGARPSHRPRRRACPFIVHVAVRALHLVYTPAHVLRAPHITTYLPVACTARSMSPTSCTRACTTPASPMPPARCSAPPQRRRARLRLRPRRCPCPSRPAALPPHVPHSTCGRVRPRICYAVGSRFL
ncbi:hypothetical protein B0H14DRAFT_1013989 [Mycena olivaceomarginata]|nr:hypothetical protein B0H14DRAFT_1013989 [Mycena olivaceomarginata]